MTEPLWLLRETYSEWSSKKAPRLAAALAYYTLFALAPMLVVVIQMGAWLLGLGHAQGHHHQLSEAIFSNLRMTVGSGPAATVAEIVQSTVDQKSQGVWANLVGWAVSLYAAAGLFSALQDAINTVWETSTDSTQSWMAGVKERLVTFGMLWVLGLLLAIASGLTTLLTAFSGVVNRIFPGAQSLLQFGNVTIFLFLAVLFFSCIFKYLPKVQLSWSDVWIGAVLTALLCLLGQALLTLYFTYITSKSTFGAASSFVVLLVWVYYSAQFFLFGAQFTKVYAFKQGSLKDVKNATVQE